MAEHIKEFFRISMRPPKMIIYAYLTIRGDRCSFAYGEGVNDEEKLRFLLVRADLALYEARRKRR